MFSRVLITSVLLVCSLADASREYDADAPRVVLQQDETTSREGETAGDKPVSTGANGLATGLIVTSTDTATLVGNLIGADMEIEQSVLIGDPNCAALFEGGTNLDYGSLGFDKGVMISSGFPSNAIGPNDSPSMSHAFNTAGDPWLEGLIGGITTHDACILEIKFSCPTGVDQIGVKYVFSSDEYPEYVDSSFNDVFGFALNGVNVALVPGTALPVSINNVNCVGAGDSCHLYVNNTALEVHLEPDGLTVALTAIGSLVPGQNTMRFAVADAGDTIYDSWVFLQGGAFTCGNPDDPVCEGDNFYGGEDLSQYWIDLAVSWGVNYTYLGYNVAEEVWCYDGVVTCVKWGEWDGPCNETEYACAGYYKEPSTNGCGYSQIKYIKDMLATGEDMHSHCPLCEADPTIGDCASGETPGTHNHDAAIWTDCDCNEHFTGIELWQDGYWWNQAVLANLIPAKVSYRAGQWYYDQQHTCVAMGETWSDACNPADFYCAGPNIFGYAADQMAAVLVASQQVDGLHPSCPWP